MIQEPGAIPGLVRKETNPQMVDRNDSFLREVDEEIRRDRLMRLWERFGVFIIAGVVLLFVGIGVYKWREAQQLALEETTGARFEAATRLASQSKGDEAIEALTDIAKDGPAGYRALASLRVAGEHAEAGRTGAALQMYEALAADSAADVLLRDFAALQAAMLRLDQADWTEMKNRLTPLAGENRPWRAPAKEVLGLAAYKAGEFEEARRQFEQLLGESSATGGISRRAQEMLAVLTDAAAAKTSPQGDAAAKAGAMPKNGEPQAAK